MTSGDGSDAQRGRQTVGTAGHIVSGEKWPEICWRRNCCGCANLAGLITELGADALKEAGEALLRQRRRRSVPGETGDPGKISGDSTDLGETSNDTSSLLSEGENLARQRGGETGTSAHARLVSGGNTSSGEHASPLLHCAFTTGSLLNAASDVDCSRDSRGLSAHARAEANEEGMLMLKSGASTGRGDEACGGSSTGGSFRAAERVRLFIVVHEDS